jgi:hypothetical protein
VRPVTGFYNHKKNQCQMVYNEQETYIIIR